ncbi:hypothetical protein N8H11_21385, partial [Mycobacterium tuberculosis]
MNGDADDTSDCLSAEQRALPESNDQEPPLFPLVLVSEPLSEPPGKSSLLKEARKLAVGQLIERRNQTSTAILEPSQDEHVGLNPG